MHRIPSRTGQRGLAALSVTLVLLVIMTLTALYLSRGVVFDIRTAANQARALQARELAQAGLDWAIARLNEPVFIDTDCVAATDAVQTFRERLLGAGDAAFVVPAEARAACTVGADGTLACSCPQPGGALHFGSAHLPRFVLRFAALSDRSVQVHATGCTSADVTCAQAESRAAATATVAAVARATPAIAHLPLAAVTAGGDVSLGSAFAATHDEPVGTGATVHAGGAITLDDASDALVGRPGALAGDTVAAQDETLRQLANSGDDPAGERLFAAFFGSTTGRFRDSPTTFFIRETRGDCPRDADACCPDARACGALVGQVWQRTGFDHFFIDGGVQFDATNLPAGTLGHATGTPRRAVLVASTQVVHLQDGVTVNGLVVSMLPGAGGVSAGTGGGHVRGAVIARGSLGTAAAAGRVHARLDSAVLAALRGPRHGPISRVPGSWRDLP